MLALAKLIDKTMRTVGFVSLNTQFFVSFLVILGLSVASGASLYLSLSISPQAIDIAGRQRMLSQRVAKEAMLAEQGLSDQRAMQKTINLFESSHKSLLEGNDSLGVSAVTDPQVLEQLYKVEDYWKAYKRNIETYVKDHNVDALSALQDQSVVVLVEMNKAVQMMAGKASNQMQSQLIIAFACVILMVVLILVGRVYGQATVMKTLASLESEMKGVGQGDFSHRFKVEHSDNEIGSLYRGFNQMLDSVGQVIKNVQAAARSTNQHVNNVTGAIEASQTGVQRQYADIEQVAAAVTEMAHTVQVVAQNAEQAAAAANEADSQARSGGNVVKQSEVFAQDMLQRINTTATTLSELEAETQAVDQVTSVINEIAEQTNLLALNAAIEAARAGEQGRGFAVVADEVRTLAQRTQESTHQIQDLVERLQGKAQTAVTSMVESTKLAQQSSELSAKAADALNQIIASTETISQMNNQISTSSVEQKEVAEDIDRRLVNISSIASGTRDDTSRVSQSTEEIRREIEELNALVAQFRTLS